MIIRYELNHSWANIIPGVSIRPCSPWWHRFYLTIFTRKTKIRVLQPPLKYQVVWVSASRLYLFKTACTIHYMILYVSALQGNKLCGLIGSLVFCPILLVMEISRKLDFHLNKLELPLMPSELLEATRIGHGSQQIWITFSCGSGENDIESVQPALSVTINLTVLSATDLKVLPTWEPRLPSPWWEGWTGGSAKLITPSAMPEQSRRSRNLISCFNA